MTATRTAVQVADRRDAAYELARFSCFRRTAEQVRTYLWDGDPEPYVTRFTESGPAQPLPT